MAGYVLAIVVAFVFAMVFGVLNNSGVGDAISDATVLSIGFQVAMMVTCNLFEGRKSQLTMVKGLEAIVILIAQAIPTTVLRQVGEARCNGAACAAAPPMRLLSVLLLALSAATLNGQELPGNRAPVPGIHLGASSGAQLLFGRDTLTIVAPDLSETEVYIDTAIEGRVGVVLPGGVALGGFPGLSYTFSQGDDGVSDDSFTLLAGAYIAYYLPVDWAIVPYVRLDNALRWNRTTATTPASGPIESQNFGYLANLDVGGAWFTAPSTAISAAVRGTLLSRIFTGAARLNLELALVVGIDLFLPR